MRQEIQLERLKQRIAESAEKAGLDSVFEGLEKNIKVCLGSLLSDDNTQTFAVA
jgi:hypothetical protein